MSYLYTSAVGICILSSCSISLDSSDMRADTKLILQEGMKKISDNKNSKGGISENLDELIGSLNKIISEKRDGDSNLLVLLRVLIMQKAMFPTTNSIYTYILLLESILHKFLTLNTPLTSKEEEEYFKVLGSVNTDNDSSNNEKCEIM